jgi:hypothetical protein
MIPKGNMHPSGIKLADYMETGKNGERAEIIERRGLANGDLRDSFADIQNLAESCTKCEKPFFHAYFRLGDDERLTRDQWLDVADRMEKALGFDGQPRAIAMHIQPDGAEHMHIAWSRIDMDEMRAIHPGLYIDKMRDEARAIEHDFALRKLSNDRRPELKTQTPNRDEFEEARRKGIDITATREAIRDCWDRSDNPASFAAALSDQGMVIARGDRRDYVVVDREGGLHGLGKHITGQSEGRASVVS